MSAAPEDLKLLEADSSDDPSLLTAFFLNKAALHVEKSILPDGTAFTVENFIAAYKEAEAADDNGAKLRKLFDWMEEAHDFIQYFFPLISKSGHNPKAPTLQPITIELFKKAPSPTLQQGYLFS